MMTPMPPTQSSTDLPAPDIPLPGLLRRAGGLFLALMLVWLALNGHEGWPVGIAAAAGSALIGAILVPGAPYAWRPAKLPSFVAFFLRQSLRGGFDVARRAFDPRMPIDPGWIDHQLALPPGQPRTLMISLVNLLPGTLVAEMDPKANRLRVHLLTRGADPGLDGLEARIAALFSLDGEGPR